MNRVNVKRYKEDGFSEAEIYEHWAHEVRFYIDGIGYRVGRMSYGDYFLEPGEPRGEQYPFNKGTLWFELADKEKRLYKLEEELR